MTIDPRMAMRRKLQAAISAKKPKDENADGLIWTAVLINAGLGAVPFGINSWTFIGVISVMISLLGGVYGHHLTNEGIGKLVQKIFMATGLSFCMFTLGLKFFAEVLKGAGVFTMGGATPVGMALDAVLCGAVTYAIGFTTKEYFKKDRKLSDAEIRRHFKHNYEVGKQKVKQQFTNRGGNNVN